MLAVCCDCTFCSCDSLTVRILSSVQQLFSCSQLFGEEDPDQDVSPDTEDPELAGKELLHLQFHKDMLISKQVL